MCGRYTLLDLSDFLAMFPWVMPPELFAPRYNVAPSQPILAVTNRSGGTLEHLLWGLVPNWAKPGAEVRSMINARCETLSQKPTFRNSLKYKRCIIPASGFYEWKKQAGPKQPYYIELKSHKPMLMAGLWEDSYDRGGGEIRTACIITTPANEAVSELHDRMPAILDPDDARRWIKASDVEAEGLQGILVPYQGGLTLTPVGRAVNRPEHDAKDCIEPITPDEDRGLFG